LSTYGRLETSDFLLLKSSLKNKYWSRNQVINCKRSIKFKVSE